MHPLRLLARGAMQVELQRVRLLAQRLEIGEILEHRARRHILLVGERERMAVAARERQSGGFAAALGQQLPQPVRPRQGRFRDAALDLGEVGLVALARVGAHHDVQARVARAGDLRVALHAGAGEAGAGDLLDALAHLGVVAVARHVHQAGVEAEIRVAPHQQAHRAALVQVDHPAHDADKIRDPGLKELIARIGLQHVEHRLAVVAARVEAEVLDDALDFLAQHRDIPRAAVISGRGPQAEEAVLAVDPTSGVEGLDADVIEQLAAVHGRGRVRLGHDQQLRLARARAHIAAQGRDARAPTPPAGAAEDAETGARVGHQAVLGPAALEPIVTVAEEHEVPAFHPVEQVGRLAHVGRRQRRGVGFEPGDDLTHPLAHRRPVRDREAHVGQCHFQVALQPFDLPRVTDAVDFVELPRLGVDGLGAVGADINEVPAAVAARLQHRVHDQVHGELRAAEGHAEGVHQERHVVGDREHQGMI